MQTVFQASQFDKNKARFIALFLAATMLANIVFFAVSGGSALAHDVNELTETTASETEQSDDAALEAAHESDSESGHNITEEIEEEATEETVAAVESATTESGDDSTNDATQTATEESYDEASEHVMPHTVYDALKTNSSTASLSATIDFLLEDGCVPVKAIFASLESVGGVTLFAPNDAAIAAIPSMELAALTQNSDELCQIVASHLHVGNVFTSDAVPTDETLILNQSADDGILVQNNGTTVTADNATVVEANISANNGVVHVIDQVILPTGAGMIDSITTEETAPAITGTISVHNPEAYVADATNETIMPHQDTENFCVALRVNGLSYNADVTGIDWAIEEGIVELDPMATDTLFSVVVRKAKSMATHAADSADATSAVMQHNAACEAAAASNTDASDTVEDAMESLELVSISMMNTVLNNNESSGNDGDENGAVKGESDSAAGEDGSDDTDDMIDGDDTDDMIDSDEMTIDSNATGIVGKAGDLSLNTEIDLSTVDTDEDGVVDSLDTEPNNPLVTGNEDTDGDGVVDRDDPEPENPEVTGLSDEGDDDNDVSSETSNLLWWFVGGGAALTLWYLLWQRGGIEE